MTVKVTITPNGRMSLPAYIRKRRGLSGGGALRPMTSPLIGLSFTLIGL